MSKYYTEDHEWVEPDSDDIATIGITDFAQEQLGEVVFVDLPEIGLQVNQGDEISVIESVKAAGEVKAPIGGVIVEINEALVDDPGLVNSAAEGEGWIVRIEPSNTNELAALLSLEDYQDLTGA